MKLFVLGLLLVAGLHSFAQKSSIFGGTFSINKSKITFGQAPESTLPESYKITPAKKHIAIVRKMDGNKEILEDMNYDGTQYKRDLPTGKATASLKWINDTSFQVDKIWMDQEGKTTMTAKEIWTVEDEGKTLKVNYDIDQANGLKYTLVGYYDKN